MEFEVYELRCAQLKVILFSFQDLTLGKYNLCLQYSVQSWDGLNEHVVCFHVERLKVALMHVLHTCLIFSWISQLTQSKLEQQILCLWHSFSIRLAVCRVCNNFWRYCLRVADLNERHLGGSFISC